MLKPFRKKEIILFPRTNGTHYDDLLVGQMVSKKGKIKVNKKKF